MGLKVVKLKNIYLFSLVRYINYRVAICFFCKTFVQLQFLQKLMSFSFTFNILHRIDKNKGMKGVELDKVSLKVDFREIYLIAEGSDFLILGIST